MKGETIKFCGIRFWNAPADVLVDRLISSGGMVVVPSAPALCDGHDDYSYLRAHWHADYAVIDSAYLAFLMVLMMKRPVARISGLKLLQNLFASRNLPTLRLRKVLWVAPSVAEVDRIQKFTQRLGFVPGRQHYYTAPHYGDAAGLDDRTLLAEVRSFHPELIIIGIGGGKQEKLGYFLRRNTGKGAAVFCTGAALSFLTGGQGHIPTWMDRAFLGWLARIMDRPLVFGARYGRAFRLPWLLGKTARNARLLSVQARYARRNLAGAKKAAAEPIERKPPRHKETVRLATGSSEAPTFVK